MNDLQIARNLGEMFENATRSLNLQFDPKNMALPPSVTSFINTNYYNIETTFSTSEIIKGLESNNDNEVYTVLKHLVGKLATKNDYNNQNENELIDSYNCDDYNETTKEIVQLFPHIIKNVNSVNLKIKRLVYIILLRFNHLQQDISLLSINAIQKSLTDKNSINRSLAIRCLSGIKIPAILPILLLSLGKLVKDSSPLVRSACAIAIIKCIELDIQYNNSNNLNISSNKIKKVKKSKSLNLKNNFKINQREYLINNLKDENSTIYQLSNYLEILLSDNDPKVLSCSIIAYYEIFNGCFDLLHNKIYNLIKHIENMDSFAISNFLDIITQYSILFFQPFDKIENASIELQDLYQHLYNMIYYCPDYNVIFSIVKCFVNIYPFKIYSGEIKLDKIMIKLIQKDFENNINDDNKILLSLNLILYLLNKEMVKFKNFQISNFLPLSNENPKIFDCKISILFELIKEDNFDVIFNELKFLVEKSDFNYIFKFKILEKINTLILNKNLKIEQFSKLIRFFMNKLQFEENELLVGEYITGLRQLIQTNLSYYNEILIKLVSRLFESYDTNKNINLLSNAKSSIIWLLGEFSINFDNYEINENIKILKEFLPDLTLILMKNFKSEADYNVRLEILIFISKMLIFDILQNGKENYNIINNKLFKIFNYVLQLTKYDIELDIRDMSRLIGSLLPNIVYYSDISINQEFEIDEILNRDPVLINHCKEKCAGIDLSVLMFQLTKPQIQMNSLEYTGGTEYENNEGDIYSSIIKYTQVSENRLDTGYLEYYHDLRNEGFELRDYGKYSSSLSSATFDQNRQSQQKHSYQHGNRDRSMTAGSNNTNSNINNNTATASSKKYKLQTLDDFLGSA